MKKTLLPINYNRATQIASFHDDQLTFMLNEKYFDDYVMLLPKENMTVLTEELGFSGKVAVLKTNNDFPSLDSALKSKKFTDFVRDNPRRKVVIYSPIDPPYKVNPLTYLMNSPTIAHAYENKRYFRDEFSDLIRMPEYEIKNVDDLNKVSSYKELRDEFGEMVLQDEESHGSRGTYIVKSLDEYVDAVKSLKKHSYGRSVVVSKYIKGQTCSIQVCITKYGIFSGGVQKQLINSKYLCNTKLEDATKWCGGEVGGEYPDIVQHQAQEIASVVGSELSSHGYKGIFGVDLIITPNNEVYAIEINARLTGYSHLISDMQLKEGKIPFMLLHILELGSIPYEVTDLDALPSMARYKKPVSYMIITNKNEEPILIEKKVRLGIYRIVNNTLEFIKAGYSISDLKTEDMVIISAKFVEGESIASGRRILQVTKLGRCMQKQDLGPRSRQIIEVIKTHFGIPE